ncbi:MAG: hypothetical protein K9G12_06210 [Candidatus Nanopelagicales bacterium]|nr:hypothetical protein [Candidatus Nanopelagicales bacterium]MCF8539857.1 hypothetical protein [Candidatus Nanopelagicales bacterium]
MGRLWVAILGLLVVAVILIIQMAQGENNALHWIGIAAVAIGLASLGMEMQKARRE